jgi:hypothetical protein
MRSKASHLGPHQTCVPVPCLSHRVSGAVTALAWQPSKGVPLLPKPAADPCSFDHRSAALQRGQRPFLLHQASRGGGRNARATSSRSRAVSGSFPPGNPLARITGCHWPAAINQQAQELSRFAAPTLIHFVAPGNTKFLRPCEEPVEEETSLWKHEEN